MIIENPDVFKSWLTSILEPLCDADPAALAKYVYALVKKDKPVEELREVMVDQLDVFLQQETKPFVEMLFTSLESQEYLKESCDDEKIKENQPPDTVEQEKRPETETNHVEEATTNGDSERAAVPRHRVVVTRGPNPAKLIAHGPVPPPAPVPVAPQHQHQQQQHAPRGPHHEQTLVKVLPLTELLEEPVDQLPRRRDRRGDSLREKEDRRRRRSRSWERRARARNRHARDNDHVDLRRYENRRPSSRSPSPRGRYRNRSPPLPERQPTRSRSRSPAPARERDHERERDRLRAPREAERDRMSRDREHRDRMSRSRDRERSRERSRDRSRERSRGSLSPVAEPRTADHSDAYKRRCRDFDEMGYCLRGDLCQWDHGNDPLVLEDSALTRVLTIPPPVPEYNPLTPDIWCGGGAGFPPYPHHHPHHPHPPRELIPIPRVRHEVPPPPGVAAPPVPMPRHPPPPKKNFDYNRIGPARPPLPANAVNCSLEVKKVPRGMNDITHLNNHFCKFGKIVNIQVCYEGDPEAALITFSNPAEANVAYKSTEAVLNNRFIKVFWHNPENKQENTAPAGLVNNKPAERSNSQHPMSHNKVLINRDNIKATQDIRQQAEKEKELTNGQEQRKEGAAAAPTPAPLKPMEKSKQVMEMYKRAQALLETQLQQQVLLIQKLESGNVTGSQKAALMEAINSAQEGIEKLQKELLAYNGIIKQMQEDSVARNLSRLQLAQANAKKPKTREEAQKEILDAELDMFTKQQEGQDVTDLVKKIGELRRQLALQFPVHPSVRRTHSRGGRFNSATRFTRGALNNKVFSVNQSVDHRPRALLISGFEADELDALVAHFSQFGEVISKQAELSVPQLVLQYKSRAHAENAALHGKNYSDRTLSITWVTNNKPTQGQTTVEQRNAATVRNGDLQPDDSNTKQETSQNVSEYALLGFDEEEEEDADEDRSWRR